MPKGILKRSDIVLVPFPFTNLTDKKIRPCVIISPDPRGTDILVAFISSIITPGPTAKTDFILRTDHPDFSKTGLKKDSLFKMSKLLCIEKSKILRRLGCVSKDIQKELDQRLKNAVGLHL